MKGYTALHYSALYNRIESTKLLLKAGINTNALNNYNQTAYDIAIEYANFDLAEQIKRHIEGKPLDQIKCFDQSEEDLSDSLDNDKNDLNDHSFGFEHSRPDSMNESKSKLYKFWINKIYY